MAATPPAPDPTLPTTSAFPEPRDAGRRRRLTVLGVWTAFATLEAGRQFVDMRLRGVPIRVDEVVIQNFPWWYTWALLTPVVVLLARRVRIDVAGSRARALAAHIPAALAAGLAHVLIAGTLYYFTTSRGNVHPALQVPMTLPLVWRNWYVSFLPLETLTYFAIVGVTYAVDYQARWREAALAAARLGARASALEHRAAEARLAALRMELHPHFLFNTLNAIAGLVRKQQNDVAVTMLARLGDLLRATLDRDTGPETTVRDELALLGHYLAIERIRFADRLTVSVECEPGTEEALLPPLILQPLAENAIRHGIARRPGPGSVWITVRHDWRDGAPVLLIEVRDTGEGLGRGAPPEARGGGVGLSNTRARLEALYGADAGLSLANADGGGARASLWLPLRTRMVVGAIEETIGGERMPPGSGEPDDSYSDASASNGHAPIARRAVASPESPLKRGVWS